MRVLWLLILLIVSCVLASPVNADEAKDKSCKRFVQEFYDWYVKKCQGVHQDDPTMDVFKNKSFAFSAELKAKLKEDHDVAKLFPGEIVGLDFDPFLNAQDIASKYSVSKVSRTGVKYHAEVFGTWNGKKSNKPDVTPELVSENGRWIFVNFLYPGSEIPVNRDLLSVLKQLKKDRPPSPAASGKPAGGFGR